MGQLDPSTTQHPLDSATSWQFGAVVGPSWNELLAAVGADDPEMIKRGGFDRKPGK